MTDIWGCLTSNLEALIQLLIAALEEDENQIHAVTEKELALNERYSTQLDHIRQRFIKKPYTHECEPNPTASSTPIVQKTTLTQKRAPFRIDLPRLPPFSGEDDNVTSFKSWLKCFDDSQEETGILSDIYYILNLKSFLKGYALTLIKDIDESIDGNKDVCIERLKNRFSRIEFIQQNSIQAFINYQTPQDKCGTQTMRRNFKDLTSLYRRVEQSTVLQGEEVCVPCGGKGFYGIVSYLILH